MTVPAAIGRIFGRSLRAGRRRRPQTNNHRSARLGQARGRVECQHGLEMLQEVRGPRRITLASDKGYDTAAFVASCRAFNAASRGAE